MKVQGKQGRASMRCVMIAATLSVAHGFTAVAPSLRPFPSPSLCAFTPRIVSNSCRVLEHVKRIQKCTRLNVQLTDSGDEHAGKRFLGSKRLHYIREKLKSGPDSLNSEKKLLGSRRLALVVSTLLHGVEDTSTKNIKRSVAAKEEATTLVVVDGSSVEKMPSQSKVAETNYAVVEMTDSVEQTIEIDATPAECYQVAAKLDDYPKWVASLESVKVLDTRSDGLAKQAKFAVGAFGQTLDYTLEYTHNVGEKLAWKAIAGSVKALVGSYTFAPLDGGKRTRVTYQLALDPGFSIPSMIKKASTKLIVTTALSDLRKYTEKPSTKALVKSLVDKQEAPTPRSSPTAPAAAPLAAEQQPEVLMPDSVEQDIDINATPAECYQVAAKLEDYPKWVASLQSVKVLDTRSDGLAASAKFAVGAFGQTLDYTLEYTHTVNEKLAWKAVAGSVKALVGSYSFAPLDGGKRTRVTYKLALDPGFSIPSMIKKASTKLIVSTALSDLRKYTENPSTKALVKSLVDKQATTTPPTPPPRSAPTAPAPAAVDLAGTAVVSGSWGSGTPPSKLNTVLEELADVVEVKFKSGTVVRVPKSGLGSATLKRTSESEAERVGGNAGVEAGLAGADQESLTQGISAVSTDEVQESIDINAPPELCYRVAATFDEYPQWVASLESVEVVEMGFGNLGHQVKFAVGAFGRSLQYTLEYTHKVPNKMSWKAISGSVKALVGSYSFAPLDGGKRTRVTYQLSLDPGFPIPGMIKRATTKLIVGTALNDLRKYAEKPETQERIGKLLAPFLAADKPASDS